MGDMADDFRALREHRRDQNAERVRIFVDETLPLLASQGYSVRQISETHYRVNNRLDLFPVHRRFHLLATKGKGRGKRGGYRDPLQIVNEFLNQRRNGATV